MRGGVVCSVCVRARGYPGPFQHSGKVADPRLQTRVDTVAPSPVHALLFIALFIARWVQLVVPSLVDFHRLWSIPLYVSLALLP